MRRLAVAVATAVALGVAASSAAEGGRSGSGGGTGSNSTLGGAWSLALARLGAGGGARLRLGRSARRQAEASRAVGATPHFVLDGVLPEELLRLVVAEIPEVGDREGCVGQSYDCFRQGSYNDYWENKKNMLTDEAAMGPATRVLLSVLRSKEFVMLLEHAFGIMHLIPDPALIGSGVHNTVPGGYLKLHVDFNYNPPLKLHRRVNAFVYLNDDWPESYGGHLELWNRDLSVCEAAVLPTFGRVVAFVTTDFSYHGHPRPLSAPVGRSRRSFAMYYYTASRPDADCADGDCKPASTRFGEAVGVCPLIPHVAAAASASAPRGSPAPPGRRCTEASGRLEEGVRYGGRGFVDGYSRNPDDCCKACSMTQECRSWTWTQPGRGRASWRCRMFAELRPRRGASNHTASGWVDHAAAAVPAASAAASRRS